MENNNISNKGNCGLVNLSNTCYLNSILQTFFNNIYIKKYILSNQYKINNNFQENLIIELDKLVKNVWEENSIILPKSFIQTLSNITKQNLNEQNDPDEYYEKIINRFYEETATPINNDNLQTDVQTKEWNKYFNNKTSFIQDLYYGQYKSETLCCSCNNKSVVYEPFITIKLELNHNSLLNCLKKHLSWENNIESKCDKCNITTKFKKRFTLINLPNTLIFTLKRYNNFMQKNDISINFPFLFEIDSNKYELTSIINHYGYCLEHGHYTTFSKNNIDKKWYEYDDKDISSININNINKSYIYMLFYTKI